MANRKLPSCHMGLGTRACGDVSEMEVIGYGRVQEGMGKMHSNNGGKGRSKVCSSRAGNWVATFSISTTIMPRLDSGLLDTLRMRLDTSLFLRSFLLLGVPYSECFETSSKLGQTFTALSFFVVPSLGAFSQL
nr:hypothetical protein [Tanacetum cinerariifolium]